MLDFHESMWLSISFVVAVLAIVMIGLITTEILKQIKKTKLILILLVYLLILLRIIIGVAILFFSMKIYIFFLINDVLLVLLSLVFFIKIKEKMNKRWSILYAMSWIFFCIMLFPPSFNGIFYYINLFIFGLFNIIFYLLILFYLASKNDAN